MINYLHHNSQKTVYKLYFDKFELKKLRVSTMGMCNMNLSITLMG